MATELKSGDSNGLLPRPCILFDWSGTISDDAEMCHASSEMIGKHFGYSVEKCTKKWANDASSSASASAAALSLQCGKLIAPSEMERLHAQFLVTIKQSIMYPSPIGNVVSQLRTLKTFSDLTIGVVSAHPQVDLLEEAIKYKLCPDVFDREMLYGGVTSKRDFLRGFVTSTEFNRNANNIIFVGDTVSDVAAAKSAGAISVAVCCGYHTRERLLTAAPDLIYDTTSDFIDDFVCCKKT